VPLPRQVAYVDLCKGTDFVDDYVAKSWQNKQNKRSLDDDRDADASWGWEDTDPAQLALWNATWPFAKVLDEGQALASACTISSDCHGMREPLYIFCFTFVAMVSLGLTSVADAPQTRCASTCAICCSGRARSSRYRRLATCATERFMHTLWGTSAAWPSP
jgi:hypothetical protein